MGLGWATPKWWREGTVPPGPPRARLTNVGGVEQLLGPQQHAVADLEYRIDPARIELRLPVRLRRREKLSHRSLHRAHPLRAVPVRLTYYRLLVGEFQVRGEAARGGVRRSR